MNSVSRTGNATSDWCRTTVTVTSSTIDGYTLLLETLDDPAHTLPRVFRGMLTHPQGKVKVCLERGSYERAG